MSKHKYVAAFEIRIAHETEVLFSEVKYGVKTLGLFVLRVLCAGLCAGLLVLRLASQVLAFFAERPPLHRKIAPDQREEVFRPPNRHWGGGF